MAAHRVRMSCRRTFRRRSTRSAEFIRRELDGEDDRIEVGVAIIGGGTAGLACANRLLALLADDPADHASVWARCPSR